MADTQSALNLRLTLSATFRILQRLMATKKNSILMFVTACVGRAMRLLHLQMQLRNIALGVRKAGTIT